jgi:TolB protein
MNKLVFCAAACLGALMIFAQQPVFQGDVTKRGEVPRIAVPDFRGTGVGPNLMTAFNQTLWSDLESSGRLTMVPKTLYPKTVPQQPADFRQPPPTPTMQRRRGQEMAVPQTGGGLWMTDWSGPPPSTNYLAFGYTAMQNGVLVLYGNLFDMSRNDPNPASQPLSKRYIASTADEKGARDIAHQFAADILKLFGGQSLFGTHIYYVHQASIKGPKEIWVMDPDGRNQRPITHFNWLSIEPAISPDGSRIAFTSYAHGNPGIFVFSVDPVRDLRFYNQVASVNGTPSFTPDGKQIIYSSSAGGCCRIFLSNLDGSGFRPITSSHFIDVEPKVNPKTGATVLFVSGRSGPQQIYMMTIDGADIQRVTDGTGEASNPSWNPDGQSFAFSWTRGYMAGKFNIFIMQDTASRRYVQLTHDEGRNENPSWAPDGVHLAFMSNRAGGRSQIFTMLADGTQPQQLTHDGYNYSPAWGK